ncbi:MAG: hypothetical protein NTX38_05125 [Methylobacter sp.]|nr:hypothetical protein [Methylobacter sp.]
MKQLFFIAALMLTAAPGMAGTITNGVWSPNSCGAEPAIPAIEQGSVDEYNQSIKVINDWQQKANAYNGCVIKEANTDNTLIANAANIEQANFKATIEKIQAETTAAKAKLDKK